MASVWEEDVISMPSDSGFLPRVLLVLSVRAAYLVLLTRGNCELFAEAWDHRDIKTDTQN